MKQKTRFKIFGHISYQYPSMNGQYIGIGPKKTYRSISNLDKPGIKLWWHLLKPRVKLRVQPTFHVFYWTLQC